MRGRGDRNAQGALSYQEIPVHHIRHRSRELPCPPHAVNSSPPRRSLLEPVSSHNHRPPPSRRKNRTALRTRSIASASFRRAFEASRSGSTDTRFTSHSIFTPSAISKRSRSTKTRARSNCFTTTCGIRRRRSAVGRSTTRASRTTTNPISKWPRSFARCFPAWKSPRRWRRWSVRSMRFGSATRRAMAKIISTSPHPAWPRGCRRFATSRSAARSPRRAEFWSSLASTKLRSCRRVCFVTNGAPKRRSA